MSSKSGSKSKSQPLWHGLRQVWSVRHAVTPSPSVRCDWGINILTVTNCCLSFISHQHCYNAMHLLNQLLPGFEAKATAAVDIESFCAPVRLPLADISWHSSIWHVIKLQAGANDACSDDTSWLKVAIAEWLNSSTSSNVRISAKVKEEHGIFNDVMGCLLCPINYDWDNPECVTTFSLPDQSNVLQSSFEAAGWNSWV